MSSNLLLFFACLGAVVAVATLVGLLTAGLLLLADMRSWPWGVYRALHWLQGLFGPLALNGRAAGKPRHTLLNGKAIRSRNIKHKVPPHVEPITEEPWNPDCN